MPETELTFGEELYQKIWRTKGSRFNAYERLRRRQKRSFYATGILSAYLIIINLLLPFGIITLPANSNIISFISVSLSIILLVFVTIENSSEYNLKGNNFHNCAKELGRVLNDLLAILDSKETDIKKFNNIAEKYADILDKYDNHSPIDYATQKTQRPKVFDINKIEKQWILFRAYYLIDIHYLALIIAPPLLFIIWLMIK